MMTKHRLWLRSAAAVLLLLAIGACGEREEAAKPPELTMVIHGGAGTIRRENMTPERERVVREKLTESLQSGMEVLRGGGSAVDAVEASIRVLEDSPLFNAGRGAVFSAEGKNELDASIMAGGTLKAGAVASVTTVRNPISAARAVMEKSKHVLLVGRGAEIFAAEQGLDTVQPEYFFDQRRWDELLEIKEEENARRNRPAPSPGAFGTVGALALDRDGNLAAGTSTGGLANKMHGRVGDSPVIGAGTYANNGTCAVSGTGQGEFFMRLLVGYDVSALMEYEGLSVEEAANRVVFGKLTDLGGLGGIIALDHDGNVAMPFNTEGMYRGWIQSDGEAHVFMYGEDESPAGEAR